MNQDSIISFLKDNITDWQNKSFLLAVSGGVDSMVLLDFFVKAKLKCFVAHCNFQLRATDSYLDEKLVTNYCAENNIPVHIKRFSTQTIETEKPTSIQMLARELRYNWFKELKKEIAYDYLVVAHHATDQIETVLLNLVRGTGISGLRGMKSSNGGIIRPLLPFSKEDILLYAEKNNIQWREDISNQKNDYKRNLIRNKVLPLLKELNPTLEQTFRKTTEKILDAESVFKAEIKALERQINQNGKYLLTNDLLQSEKVNPTLLFENLKEYGFVYEQVKSLFQKHNSGSIVETEKYQLIKIEIGWQLVPKEQLVFKPLTISSSDLEKEVLLLSGSVSFRQYSKKDFKLKKDKTILSLDMDLVQFPITVRQWELGDKFAPFGMNGQKKVSDLLIDAKVPLHEKAKVFVVEDLTRTIMGVINFRSDDRYKISENTTSVLEITYTPA